MEIIIRGDKLKITDAIKKYIIEKISKLDKYLENSSNVRATVVVKVRNNKQMVEVTIPLKSIILRSEQSAVDVYAAIDEAQERLERQIRKNKTKLMNKQSHSIDIYDFLIDNIEDDEEEVHKVIKRKSIEIKPMSDEEAILQMELLGHQFYMYKNSDTMEPSVIYKRHDGGYGIIESN